MEMIENNWLLLLIVAVLAVLIAWYVFHAARRTRVTGDRSDVLDDGAAPAARNQALIDAAPAAAKPSASAQSKAHSPSTPPAKAAPKPVVTGNSSPQSNTAGGDLNRIKGVGPKLIVELEALGVTSLAQIAKWTKADVEKIDAKLGRFQGRIARDEWVEQARLLTKGDDEAYAKRFGNA